jgi:hypothetical protein
MTPTCLSCGSAHALCPYDADEARAIRTAREASRSARTGTDSGSPENVERSPQSDAGLAGGIRDAEQDTEPPLAAAQRRLGKPGPKPSRSRWARYRRRHPEYVARERMRRAGRV